MAGSIRRMKLGSQGMEVSAQGLGCMGMSAFYGPPKPDSDMIALIHHAVQKGVTMLDTSDMYGPFTNEILLGKALQGGVREKVELATKFGISLADGKMVIKGDPAYVRACCEASLERLQVDCIDLYYQHRVDTSVPIEVTLSTSSAAKAIEGDRGKVRGTVSERKYGRVRRMKLGSQGLEVSFADGNMNVKGNPTYVKISFEASLRRLQVDCIDLYYQHRIDSVPIEVTVGELKKLVEEGKIKYIGLSEASASSIRRAHAVHPITAVQLEWSLWTRDVEEEIVPTCRELGIGIVAYSPLGKGFLSEGAKMVENLDATDFRKYMPGFQPENVEHNKLIFERVKEIASKKGCTPSQLALAWVHHQGTDVCPIPGTTKIENFNQNIGALSVKLTPEEMAELESLAFAGAVKGGRYDGVSQTWKDSDTPALSTWKM